MKYDTEEMRELAVGWLMDRHHEREHRDHVRRTQVDQEIHDLHRRCNLLTIAVLVAVVATPITLLFTK